MCTRVKETWFRISHLTTSKTTRPWVGEGRRLAVEGKLSCVRAWVQQGRSEGEVTGVSLELVLH